jgi:hypothetical protein
MIRSGCIQSERLSSRMTKGASLVPLPFGRLKGPRRDHDSTTYQLIEGDELRILHHGNEIALTAAAPTVSRRTPTPSAAEPAQGPGAVDPATPEP